MLASSSSPPSSTRKKRFFFLAFTETKCPNVLLLFGLLWKHVCMCCICCQGKGLNWPECSSFTRDDIVFVIESAATNRSFRRFLGTPGKPTPLFKSTYKHAFYFHEELLRRRRSLTLSKSLQHVAPHPRQAVLGRVGRGGAGRRGADGHGHGAAGAVAWWGMGGSSRLRMQRKHAQNCQEATLSRSLVMFCSPMCCSWTLWRWL